jgi:acetyl esterase
MAQYRRPIPALPLPDRLRRQAGAAVVDGFFENLSRLARLHPLSSPERHDVEILRDLPYRRSGRVEHLLDIYRPRDEGRPWPVVLYVHGGGFRILSKDTHWLMALAFARRGFLVVNINYRLAPANPYPAAHADAAHAYAWVVANIEKYGGDLDRFVLAGESAGANLVTSLAIAASYERPEPFAREVFTADVSPTAVLAACGILQVSDCARFGRRKPLPGFLVDRLEEVADNYLGPVVHLAEGGTELADPLLFLERHQQPVRKLPPFFAPVGTKDPLLDDTRRLKAALDRLEVPCEVRYYPGEVHAFHAFLWRSQARQCWKDKFDFLDRWVSTDNG